MVGYLEVILSRIMAELNTLDEADFVRDVEKAPCHELSQDVTLRSEQRHHLLFFGFGPVFSVPLNFLARSISASVQSRMKLLPTRMSSGATISPRRIHMYTV